ncbi:hypothetical protein ACH5RR_024660 [Cinchona calisaya]|uniref:APO domain-containing protein n=1 Tax=Cinchona calisaya TaxID=153742 RepID=A0ABD2YYF2_9GENT
MSHSRPTATPLFIFYIICPIEDVRIENQMEINTRFQPVVRGFRSTEIHHNRLGIAVYQDKRLQVDRFPAMVKLCIQAGMDIPEYPTRREYSICSVTALLLELASAEQSCYAALNIHNHMYNETRFTQSWCCEINKRNEANGSEIAISFDEAEKIQSILL